jgi:hypothetical protein
MRKQYKSNVGVLTFCVFMCMYICIHETPTSGTASLNGQKVFWILWNMDGHYCVHKTLPLDASL